MNKLVKENLDMVKQAMRPGEGPTSTMTDRMNRFLTEGRAAHENFTQHDADPEQLRRGIDVESEHTKDPEVAKKIALDHLAEFKNYYSLLDAMESHARDKQNDY